MKLIHDLRLWQKLALLGLISLMLSVPLGSALIRAKWIEASVARTEADGLEPAGAMLRLLQVTQQHRGLSAGWLNGNAAMGAQREARQRDVDAAIARMVDTFARYDRPVVRARREAIVAGWDGLPAAVASKSLAAPASFARHTDLVALQIRALEDVLDVSTMALDPEAPTYYLMQGVFIHLPPVTEALGQLRARGSAALSAGALPPAERAWVQLKQQTLREAFRAMQDAYRKAFAEDPRLETVAGEKVSQAVAALDAVVQLIDRTLLQPEVPDADAAGYFKDVTDAIDRQFALADVTFDAISTILTERAAGAKQVAVVALAGIVAAILFSTWLMILMSRHSAHSAARTVAAARALAEGDLTHRVDVHSKDEIGEIGEAIDEAMSILSRTVAQVLDSVDSVASASAQIAQGNGDLSARTEQQAASLEQTAASMGHMTEVVAASADSAQQANALAATASAVAGKGGAVVDRVVATMQSIQESSRRIADIIGVIDGIAFQTNILALNAAVEAARAGEQGRGFAVVASEVRSLAQRSATAAQEIKGLIGASVEHVDNGSALVGEAGRTMAEIVDQVHRVTDLIGQVTESAREQSTGIEEVNAAVSLIDVGTQQNAALVEQSMAAAQLLRDQAARLAEAAKFFRIDRSRLQAA